MHKLDTGVIIAADFIGSDGRAAGRHNAVVLTKADDISASGRFEVAIISSKNYDFVADEFKVEVPKRVLDAKRKMCWVYCSWLRELRTTDDYRICDRRCYGPFLLDVLTAVQTYRAELLTRRQPGGKAPPDADADDAESRTDD